MTKDEDKSITLANGSKITGISAEDVGDKRLAEERQRQANLQGEALIQDIEKHGYRPGCCI